MTTTHTTTDLGLWWPCTDQGKTPWRVKTLREGEKALHEEKTQIMWSGYKLNNMPHTHAHIIAWVVEGGLLVKALDCGSKGPGFQSHLQQRFISLLGALSPTPKIEQKVYPRVLRRGH